jgi:uncharacterized membrane protein YkoI
MTIKNSMLMLTMATALTGGAYAMTAHAATEATEAANKATAEASEKAADATEKATDDRNDAIDDKYVPASGISAQVIYDQLTKAGYTDIDDIQFDDKVWNAEAKDPSGQKVKLTLDPNDGHILTSKKD